MGLLIGYFSLAVTHNRRSFRSHSPKTISTPSMIFSSRSLNIRDVCLRQMSSAEKSVCTDCHTGSRNQTVRFSIEDRIYFAGMRIKIFERFFIFPNFSDGCPCIPHAYPAHHGVAGQRILWSGSVHFSIMCLECH